MSSKRSPTEALHPLAERIGAETPAIQIVRALAREDERAVRAVDLASRPIAAVAEKVAAALSSGGRLIYVGAGTSGRLGALDAAECPPTFGVPPSWVQAVIAGGPKALTRAVEGAEDRGADGKRAIVSLKVDARDVVCGISASGGARFVLAALAEAKKRGAFTVLVTSNPDAGGGVDERIVLDTGPELIAGSTRLKAGTATKLTLNAISTAAMVKLGRVERGRMSALKATNAKLAERAERIVAELTGVDGARAKALLRRAQGDVRKAVSLALLVALCGVVLLAPGCKRHPVVDAGAPAVAVPEEAPDAEPTVTVTAGAAVVIPVEKPAPPMPEPIVDAGTVNDAGEPDAGAEAASPDAGPSAVWTTVPEKDRGASGVSDVVQMKLGSRLPVKFEGPIVGVNCDGKIVEAAVNGMNVALVAVSPGTTHCVFKIFSPNLPGRYFEITVAP